MSNRTKTALVIGAGPGGLTAAYEFLTRTDDILPIVVEADDQVGGISRTIRYKGNRMDIGGHRFFSKSDRVMAWWANVLPIAGKGKHALGYQGQRTELESGGDGPDPEKDDRVMLVRPRKSRIYFMGKFFDYPIALSGDTLRKLGPVRLAKIGTSYIQARLFPYRNPENLEEFYINQFGRELYRTFFESYTEKVWGVPCREISAEWGAQRVKGLSLTRAAFHFFKKIFHGVSLGDKSVETSLIEEFLYPKYGPGHLWETVAADVEKLGGIVHLGHELVGLRAEGERVASARVRDKVSGEIKTFIPDYVFSTMPVKDLLNVLQPPPARDAHEIGTALQYRSFITVGLLLKKLRVVDEEAGGLIKDTWIYIQEPGTKVGRVQFFNNWSPYMVADPETVWIGLEFFCNEDDDMWNMPDEEFIAMAVEEVERIGLIDANDVLDATVKRMKKTYPGYFGAYERFDVVREYVDRFENLFLIGRNGMHKYNNQDHSMLTAMTAVDNIIAGRKDKSNIWEVNTEQDYHEAKKDGT